MIAPLLIAALVVGGVADIMKDINSSQTRDSQLYENDRALRLEEERNASLAQQARLAVMGGAFSGGTYNQYIGQQTIYSNADLVARRNNIASARSSNRFQEVMSIGGDVAKTAASFASAAEAEKGIKDANAAVSTLKNINKGVSKVIKQTEPDIDYFKSIIDKAGDGISSYLGKIEDAAKTGMAGLGAAGVEMGKVI